jgi:hypothetical protein
MAVLTNTGITFSDATSLNSKYGIFPQTTPVVFYQAAAPTGWAIVTTHNDKTLRIVSGTGAGSAGTNVFTNTLISVPVTATVPVSISGLVANASTIDVNTMVQHAHPANAGGNAQTGTPGPGRGSITRVANGGGTGNNGGSGSHTHPVTFSSANGPLNTSVDFRVQYIDVIYCTFT